MASKVVAVSKNEAGNTIRKVGVMGIVIAGGAVNSDDHIVIKLPNEPHQALEYIW